MSRSYWRAFFAFALILVASSPTWQRSHAREHKSEAELGAPLGRIADAIDKANDPKRETVDCPKGRDDRKSDLCAQWKAADAAKRAADAADVTNAIGWVGVVLGAITLVAAVAAAIYSKIAGDAAKKALTNSEMPFLAVDMKNSHFYPKAVAEEGIGDLWQIALMNVGVFPAKITQVWASPIYLSLNEVPNTETSKGRAFPDGFLIKPGDAFHLQSFDIADFDADRSRSVVEGQQRVWFVGFVRYQNIYGQNYIARFCLSYEPEHGQIQMAGDYNGTKSEKSKDVVPPSDVAIARIPYIV